MPALFWVEARGLMVMLRIDAVKGGLQGTLFGGTGTTPLFHTDEDEIGSGFDCTMASE